MLRSEGFTQRLRAPITEQLRERSQTITQSLQDGKSKNAIKELDGVRAIACLSVASFHIDLWSFYGHVWSSPRADIGGVLSSFLLAGETGVVLFFILSGFLLFLPFARAILFEHDWPSLPRFYVRRAFRILPGYYLALLLMTLFVAPEYFGADHWKQFWLFLTFRMDFPSTYQQINPPFWTLAIEFQFYMLLPLLAWLMARISRGGSVQSRLRKLIACLVAMFAWGLFSRYWGLNPHMLDAVIPQSMTAVILPYVYGTSGTFFDVFSTGMLVAVIYTYVQNTTVNGRLQAMIGKLSLPAFIAGLLVLNAVNLWHYYVIYVSGWTLHFLDPYKNFMEANKFTTMQACFGLGYGLCLFAILHGPAWLKRPFTWAPLRWFGFISYSFYLWHDQFVIFFQQTLLPKFQHLGWSQPAQYAVYVLWVVVTVIPLSIVLYRWVEMPGIRLGEKLCQRLERRKTSSSAGLPVDVIVPLHAESVLDRAPEPVQSVPVLKE